MEYSDVNLFLLTVKLDGLRALFVAAWEGFLFFVWPLCGVLLGLFLEYFALFRRVTGSMHRAFFCTGQTIARMACIIFLALSGAALLRVGWRGGFSPLTLPSMTVKVGFCPVGIFRSVTNFVKLFRNFCALKFFTCILVSSSLEISAL